MLKVKSKESFNRTIVELKLNFVSHAFRALFTFNRTIVELKPRTANSAPDEALTFNRTIVELKLEIDLEVVRLHVLF